MSDLSRQIYERVYAMSEKGKIRRKTINIEDREPITIGSIRVTAFNCDHSIPYSSMILLEAEGKRILHTGDYRNHGYTGRHLKKTLKEIRTN